MTQPAFPFAATTYALTDAGFAGHRIAGRWVGSIGGGAMDVENPRHGAVMGRVAMGEAVDVDAAVAAAKAAFPAWRDTPPKARALILQSGQPSSPSPLVIRTASRFLRHSA